MLIGYLLAKFKLNLTKFSTATFSTLLCTSSTFPRVKVKEISFGYFLSVAKTNYTIKAVRSIKLFRQQPAVQSITLIN